MQNQLAENIRSYRKSMGLTQEQLAERLSITLGTVSKWERGSSEPGIDYIIDLAELFHVSVDALIGFSMRGSDADAEAERIRTLMDEKGAEEACAEYDKALMKFPNHFATVYGAAECFMQVGTVYSREDRLKQALELFRHAIELIAQNRDPKINRVVIRNMIAECYSNLKDHKRAVAAYKENNIYGINNARIGLLLLRFEKNNKEGIEYIETAFLDHFLDMVTIMSGYVMYYLNTHNVDMGLRVVDWSLHYLSSMKDDPDRVTYLDKMVSMNLLLQAIGLDAKGRIADSEKSLRQAVRLAKAFDAAPVYTMENIVFYEHMTNFSIYDNVGPTAMDGLKKTLEEAEELVTETFLQKFRREAGEV